MLTIIYGNFGSCSPAGPSKSCYFASSQCQHAWPTCDSSLDPWQVCQRCPSHIEHAAGDQEDAKQDSGCLIRLMGVRSQMEIQVERKMGS
jgi:hypothetical protein